MKILLIIPAYNEEECIEKTVNSVIGYAGAHTEYELDYVVINDGSTDATERICRENGFRVINLIQNLGIGGAVQTGYIYADLKGYDIAVQFDGDGQHDIDSLDALIAPIVNGESDFVIGSRFIEDGASEFKSTYMRRVGIGILSSIIWAVTGNRLTDPTSGFRAAGKSAISLFAGSYPIDYPEPESIVMLSNEAGLRIKEVPVRMFGRAGGTSSISPAGSVYYMMKVSFAILCTGFKRKKG